MKIKQLEQKALQTMMDPHFIFNVINSIQYFINTGDKEAANRYLADFAKLIRISSSFANKSSVLFEEEISYLNLYLSFEKLRFGENLSYEIIIDPEIDAANTSMAAMMIQPFLENAIWHGILPAGAKGHIQLSIHKQSETFLKIIVEDNGVGIRESFISNNLLNHLSGNHGSCIAIQRLKLLEHSFDHELYLRYKHLNPGQENKGTIAEFLLPATLNS